jgi:ADP-ribosyl-[dinitrogen reductase] hydrolase
LSKNDSKPSLFDGLPDAAELLDVLFESKKIALNRGRVFSACPDALDIPKLIQDQRIEGMLLGVAVGDALGHSTEWKFDPASRHERFGTILDHLPDTEVRTGRISDDSQMTLWLVEKLLARGHFNFDDVCGLYVDRQSLIVGMGSNTAAALARHRKRFQNDSIPIEQCVGDPTSEGRGNGALMRFSPIVLSHLRQPTKNLWSDAVMSAFITHGNTVALSSAVAATHLLWNVLQRPLGDCPVAEWWLDEYLNVARDLEIGALPVPLNTDPIPQWIDGFRGTLCDFLDGPVRNAFRKGVPLYHACSLKGFGSRADCTQTVPAVLYVLMCHADSFEASIIASVNDTKDNDSVAAIVGAFAGALHGKRAIRAKWLHGIRSYSLRINGLESLSDRDAMHQLCLDAVRKFLGD